MMLHGVVEALVLGGLRAIQDIRIAIGMIRGARRRLLQPWRKCPCPRVAAVTGRHSRPQQATKQRGMRLLQLQKRSLRRRDIRTRTRSGIRSGSGVKRTSLGRRLTSVHPTSQSHRRQKSRSLRMAAKATNMRSGTRSGCAGKSTGQGRSYTLVVTSLRSRSRSPKKPSSRIMRRLHQARLKSHSMNKRSPMKMRSGIRNGCEGKRTSHGKSLRSVWIAPRRKMGRKSRLAEQRLSKAKRPRPLQTPPQSLRRNRMSRRSGTRSGSAGRRTRGERL
mmetsp:Transcript_65247/g.114015  ORF Transcript_65247/g.114015 Transcript_65247/m.114015 type:complete len:276 (-) Transcript_65247:498-1325(-)